MTPPPGAFIDAARTILASRHANKFVLRVTKEGIEAVVDLPDGVAMSFVDFVLGHQMAEKKHSAGPQP